MIEEGEWKTELSYRLSSVLILLTLAVSLIDLFYPPIFFKETLSSKAQVVGQDLVNLFLGVPVLVLSLYFSRKGSIKARIILLGVQAYFAYTFLSYAVLFKLNPGFLLYTAAFGVSFYATLLDLAGFSLEQIEITASRGTRRSSQYALAFVVLVMVILWSPDLVAYYVQGEIPSVISQDGFHTLVLPFQDFSIILPLALITLWLIRRDVEWGYILTPVVLVKVFSIAVAVIGMIITMSFYEAPVSLPQIIIFSVASLVVGAYMRSYFKNIQINRLHKD